MIVNFEDLADIREKHSSEVILFMGGCFDIVHEGHVLGMSYGKSMADILVVGVSGDERVRQRKGPTRPIRSETGRLMLVDALKPVDYTFKMPMPQEDSPTLQVIKHLKPNIFMDHEANWGRWMEVVSYIEELGTRVVFNDSPVLDSTTRIIQRILDTEQ